MMLLVVCLTLLGLASAERARYEGHKVYRVTPEHDNHMKWLMSLSSKGMEVDFWKEPRPGHPSADIRVHPRHQQIFTDSLEELLIDYEVVVEDVQRVVEENILNHQLARARAHFYQRTDVSGFDAYNYTYYRTYDEIEAWLNEAATLCGARCQLHQNWGRSYENRTLYIMQITNGDPTGKMDIWIDAGIHAREWISHAVAQYFIEHFISDYGTDPEVTAILDNYNVFIDPTINPDGYVYSHEEERLWRKTRKPNQEGDFVNCIGSDANRNYDFMWHTTGTSNNTCSDTYPGDYPHSEPETQAHSDFMLPTKENWALFFTMHSYGQLWMTPYGYTQDRPHNYDELMRVAEAGAAALTAVYGTSYEVGQASHILYESSGTSRDWGQGVLEADYVYTIELRDEGRYGFLLPADQILPTCEETWEGVQTMIMEMFQ